MSFSTPGIDEDEEGEGADDGIDEDAGTVGADADADADAWLDAAGRTITSRTRTRKGGRHAKSDSTSSHCDCGFFKPIAMRVRLATTVPLSLRSGWSMRKPLGIGVSDVWITITGPRNNSAALTRLRLSSRKPSRDVSLREKRSHAKRSRRS